jgi:TonB family protein
MAASLAVLLAAGPLRARRVRADPIPANSIPAGPIPADPIPADPTPHPSPAPGPHAAAQSAAAVQPAIIPPRALSDTRVDYPPGASGNARVELELSIDASGGVVRAVVLSGVEPFAEAARAAAQGWAFEPALRDGVPVAARIRFGVGFEQQVVEAPAPATLPSAPPPGASPAASATPAPTPPEPLAVTVTAARPVGARIISRAFARELPGAFGNPFAAIEASPGVTPTLSGAPYFYVRGSPPGNLGYFIDDIQLPALFHVLPAPRCCIPRWSRASTFIPGPIRRATGASRVASRRATCGAPATGCTVSSACARSTAPA